MDIKLFAAVFGTVFLAELGDKTQLATLLFATKKSVSLMTVFAGASLALIAATSIAVVGGSLTVDTIPRVARMGADVVAVRGAACRADRTSGLDPRRIRQLVACLRG